jgi:Asp/Glu/hydantoin racemase
MDRPLRIVLIGPTSAPWDEVSTEVGHDLARLARPGVELTYLHVGKGPRSITTEADAAAAAPYVLQAVLQAERDGFDAAIVDCTDDPGVVQARGQAAIPVVGPGEALREAIAQSPAPVVVLSGEQLRSSTAEQLLALSEGARTVALGGTGWSHLTSRLIGASRVVLDPLDVALDRCLELVRSKRQAG